MEITLLPQIKFLQHHNCIEDKLNDPGPMYWDKPSYIPRIGEIVYIRGKNDLPREVVSVIYVGMDEILITVKNVSDTVYKANRKLVWGKD
jgi:hypothetical protein